MKKINEMAQTLHEVSDLIQSMEIEIEDLRYLVYRYYLKHGNSIEGKTILLPESWKFIVSVDGNDNTICKIVDHEKMDIKSRYQKIKSKIETLN